MTVCKRCIKSSFRKGTSYKRADLFDDELQGYEKMASTYYDPNRDELYSFFDQNSTTWKNVYVSGILEFSHRKKKKIGKQAAWEVKRNRHVFLRLKGQRKSEYTYLGICIGESFKIINKVDTRIFQIH